MTLPTDPSCPSRRAVLLTGAASLLWLCDRGLAAGPATPAAPATTAPAPRPPAGVYHAELVPKGAPVGGSLPGWWGQREKRLAAAQTQPTAQTRPGAPAAAKEVARPIGTAVDPSTGDVVFTERPKDGPARVVRVAADGTETTLAAGDAAGTPHFVIVHSSGTVFWSGFPDGGTRSVRPGGRVVVHTPRVMHTYGIALSPDERWLYVASKIPDAARRGVWRFPVDKDGTAGEGEFFLQVQRLRPEVPGLPAPADGSPSLLGWVGRLQALAVDELGHLYFAGAEAHPSGDAVAVVTPDGQTVAAMILDVQRNISQLVFGGADGRTLYIRGGGTQRQVRLPVAGAEWKRTAKPA